MHQGHRERMKKRFEKEGLDNFEDHQILELLLFFTIPRRDTNIVAHNLLKKFGTVSGVFEASVEQLKTVEGIGRHSAMLLSLIPSFSRVYMNRKWGHKPLIATSEKAGGYAVTLFAGKKYEIFCLIALDSQNRVNNTEIIQKGTINEAAVYPRLIVESALRNQANSVIIAHNHPGGSLRPSRADINVTRKIKEALAPISISLVDHVIVAGEKYISLAEKGFL